MTTLAQLLEQKAALERQISQAQSESRAHALEKIRTLMSEHGLTPADLAEKRTRAAGATSKPVAAKYRDGAGNTWSGRGLKPKWLQAALAGGATLDQFAI